MKFFYILSILIAANFNVRAQTAAGLLDSAAKLQFRAKDLRKAASVYEEAFKYRQPYDTYYYYYQAAVCNAVTGNEHKAIYYLNYIRSLGYVNYSELAADTSFIRLNSNPEFTGLMSGIKSDQENYLKSLDPARYGLTENKVLSALNRPSEIAGMNGKALYRLLTNWDVYPSYPHGQKGKILKYDNKVNDTLSIPFYVYIPKGYDSKKPSRLLMYLPGGWWGRAHYNPTEAKEIVFENPTFPYLEKENIIEVYPALDRSVAMFRTEGYENIRKILLRVKNVFNIDDNRVYLAGFSDGGSSAYNIASGMPTDFAAFYAINGWASDLTSFANYSTRPVIGYSAEKDMYSNRTMLDKAAFAGKYGAEWKMTTIPGQGHFYYPYADQVVPSLFDDIKTRKRDPVKNHIIWYASSATLNRCDWLEFHPDMKKEGPPLHSDTLRTKDMDGEKDKTIEYGTHFSQAEASFAKNTFEIKISKADRLYLYINPEMVDLTRPVRVYINGKLVFNKQVVIDKDFMIKNFLTHPDRKTVYVNKLDLVVN